MKKLSLLAAAALVMAWAGNAQAATDSKQLTATANIAAVVTLTTVDGTFECGTVAVGSTQCEVAAARNASFTVVSNSDWTIALADDATGAAANQITLSHTNAAGGYSGDFVLKLALSTAGATATGGTTVTVSEQTPSLDTTLDVADEYGSYSGTGTITLTGT